MSWSSHGYALQCNALQGHFQIVVRTNNCQSLLALDSPAQPSRRTGPVLVRFAE